MWRPHAGPRQDTWADHSDEETGHEGISHMAGGQLTELRYTFSANAWHLSLIFLVLCTGIIPGPVMLWLSFGMFMASILLRLSSLKEPALEDARTLASGAAGPLAVSFPHSGSAGSGAAVLLMPPGHGFLHVAMMDDGIWGSATETACHSAAIDILTEADLASLPTHFHNSDSHQCSLAPRNSFSIACTNSNQDSNCCHCHSSSAGQQNSSYNAVPCMCTQAAAWSTSRSARNCSSSGGGGNCSAAAAAAGSTSSFAGEALLPLPAQTGCTTCRSTGNHAAQQALPASRNSISGTDSLLLPPWPHRSGNNSSGPAAAARMAAGSASGMLTSCSALAVSGPAADGAIYCHADRDCNGSSVSAAGQPSSRLSHGWGSSSSSSSLDSFSEDKPVCAVCLESYKDGQLLITLPCKHVFHKDCISLWLVRQGRAATCPLCKAAVFW